MANTSLADQLDDAVEMMIAEPDSAPPRVDLKIGELLGIAAELRLMPDPAFRAALKAELLGQVRVVAREHQVPSEPREDEPILPTLFGAGYANSVHRGPIAASMGIHVALIAILVASGLWLTRESLDKPVVTSVLRFDVTPYPLRLSTGRDGGGGARDKSPASKGVLPRFSREQLTPPTIVVPKEPPKLAVDMTVLGPPELSKAPTSQIGDPLSKILGSSNGRGSGGGIGDGYGGGVGHGMGAYLVGGGVSAPRALYDPDPEYSEEARLAKYQGTVMLWVVVGTDGRAREIRVQRSLGMGLDEKAIEAIRSWRFQPGMKDGVPVAVQVNIEVAFHLL